MDASSFAGELGPKSDMLAVGCGGGTFDLDSFCGEVDCEILGGWGGFAER